MLRVPQPENNSNIVLDPPIPEITASVIRRVPSLVACRNAPGGGITFTSENLIAGIFFSIIGTISFEGLILADTLHKSCEWVKSFIASNPSNEGSDSRKIKTSNPVSSLLILIREFSSCWISKWETFRKALLKFIGGGNKVKVSMRFRGREMEHKNLGFDLLKKLTEQVVEQAKVEVHPKSEGRQIMMILVPQVAK